VHGSAVARSPLSRCLANRPALAPAVLSRASDLSPAIMEGESTHPGKVRPRSPLCCLSRPPSAPIIAAISALLSAIRRHPWQLCPRPQIARRFMAVAPRSPLCSPPRSALLSAIRRHPWQLCPRPQIVRRFMAAAFPLEHPRNHHRRHPW
jgi:hypothetical protein